jgi:protein-disulfide isomerase
VRASPFSHVLGIPLPTLGLVGLAALLAIAVVGKTPHVQKVVTGIAGAAALVLIALQLFVIKAVCAWCMTVDIAVIVAAGAALAIRTPDREPVAVRGLWAAAAAAALVVPFVAGAPPTKVDLPAGIAELQARDKITIVTFTDFECPFCRMMHPVIEELAREHPDRVHVVRLMVPLEMHPGAVPAARAFLCTPPELRERLADRLYAAEPGTLNRHSAIEHAVSVGADEKAVEACYGAAETTAQLENDRALFGRAGLSGLPSTYVGSELIEGAETDRVREAVTRALKGGTADTTWMLIVLACVLLGAASASVFWTREERGRSPSPASTA